MRKLGHYLALILKILFAGAMIGLTAVLFWSLKNANLLPDKLFWIALAVFCIVVLILVILVFARKPYLWQKISCWILVICLLCVQGIGITYLNKTSDFLSDITTSTDEMKHTVSVVALKSSSLDDPSQLNGKTVAVVGNVDKTAVDACIDSLKNEGITVQTEDYNGIIEAVGALYDKKVDALIVSDTFINTILENEDFSDYYDKTKTIYTSSYTTQRIQTTKKVDSITSEPFTVLISGSDSRNGLDEIARSDVNMLAVVNPKTSTVLLVGIPRDYYVEFACEGNASGCPAGQEDKLTHSGLFGVETTKATIEKLLDVEINYTMRVNFDSVVNLVDALGGIDVYVEKGYAVDSFWTNNKYGVHEGWNELNGDAALAYSRERYAYTEGDRQRVRNQQQVLQAIAKKATSASMVTNYTKFLDALSGAFETDLTNEEIQQLIQYQIQEMPGWKFYTYSVDGSGGSDFAPSMGSNAYVMYPNEKTVKKAKTYIDDVLDGNNSDLPKEDSHD